MRGKCATPRRLRTTNGLRIIAFSCGAMVGRDALIAPHSPLSCRNWRYVGEKEQSGGVLRHLGRLGHCPRPSCLGGLSCPRAFQRAELLATQHSPLSQREDRRNSTTVGFLTRSPRSSRSFCFPTLRTLRTLRETITMLHEQSSQQRVFPHFRELPARRIGVEGG